MSFFGCSVKSHKVSLFLFLPASFPLSLKGRESQGVLEPTVEHESVPSNQGSRPCTSVNFRQHCFHGFATWAAKKNGFGWGVIMSNQKILLL